MRLDILIESSLSSTGKGKIGVLNSSPKSIRCVSTGTILGFLAASISAKIFAYIRIRFLFLMSCLFYSILSTLASSLFTSSIIFLFFLVLGEIVYILKIINLAASSFFFLFNGLLRLISISLIL